MSKSPQNQKRDLQPLREAVLCQNESPTDAVEEFETIEEELSRRVDEHFFLRLKANSARDWQTFFEEFFPIAHEAARQKLGSVLHQHCEDVVAWSLKVGRL